MLREFYENHMHMYIYLWILLVQDQLVAMLRFTGSVSDLPLLTINDYYYTHDKMLERKMVTG
jgi:hypothetical protein